MVSDQILTITLSMPAVFQLRRGERDRYHAAIERDAITRAVSLRPRRVPTLGGTGARLRKALILLVSPPGLEPGTY